MASHVRYLLSDGLADDPGQCMDFLDARMRHGQRVPIIHTVGAGGKGACERTAQCSFTAEATYSLEPLLLNNRHWLFLNE
jgi:hypothetical protein